MPKYQHSISSVFVLQDSDISWPSLDLNTPQDALQQQLAEMQDDLQHAWDVNEDLQAKLEATERSSAEHSSRVSLDLYYAVQVIQITGLLRLPVVPCRYVVHWDWLHHRAATQTNCDQMLPGDEYKQCFLPLKSISTPLSQLFYISEVHKSWVSEVQMSA